MICETCGVQRIDNPELDLCPICADERQYVPATGQEWRTLDEISAGRQFEIIEREAGVYEIRVTSTFAIGQRMWFIKTEGKGVLWDCVPMVDPEVKQFFDHHGGVSAMAISHPHFYSTIKAWSELLSIPVYVHENDARWIGQPFESLVTWSGTHMDLNGGAKLICAGGHFEGSSVMIVHRANGDLMFSGDTVFPNPDRKSVSFMRSFPNRLPLGPSKLSGIENAMQGIDFEKIYGPFPDVEILENARQVFDFSVQRHKLAIAE